MPRFESLVSAKSVPIKARQSEADAVDHGMRMAAGRSWSPSAQVLARSLADADQHL